MLTRLARRLFGTAAAATSTRHQLAPIDLPWRAGTTAPIVDWRAAWKQHAPPPEDAAGRMAYGWRAAVTWLDALRERYGAAYRLASSAQFLYLTSLDPKAQRLLEEYCERSRRRILRLLDGVAAPWGYGPHAVLVFDHLDDYYDYVSNYYADGGEYAQSSGMFLQYGYGHFVFVRSDLTALEPIVVHELTHCLVATLPLPAWLNEGTAVLTEHRLAGQNAERARSLYAPRELMRRRAVFWNADTIQQFWSGKSFERPDEGNKLSYDLGEELTQLIAGDYSRYARFMHAAHSRDAGEAAAHEELGCSLGDLAAAVLGPGEWTPDPAAWRPAAAVAAASA